VLPHGVDFKSIHAIKAYFQEHKEQLLGGVHPSRVNDEDRDDLNAAHGSFMSAYTQHLEPLVGVYSAMYGEHGIVGREHGSAIPLYVLAQDMTSTRAEETTGAPSQKVDEEEPAVVTALKLKGRAVPSEKVDEEEPAFVQALKLKGRRRAQTEREVNMCEDNGYSYDTSESGRDGCTTWTGRQGGRLNGCWDWSASGACGHQCKDTRSYSGSPYRGQCHSYSPECSNECNGMCGPDCDCWPGVCGDCCVWLGCYEHDGECTRAGQSWFNFRAKWKCYGRVTLDHFVVEAGEAAWGGGASGRQNWCTQGEYEATGSGGTLRPCSRHSQCSGDTYCDDQHDCYSCSYPREVLCDAVDGDCSVCGVSAGSSSGGSDTCRYANDGMCDDGSNGGTAYCTAGTDATDCGGGSSTCTANDSCRYAFDGECDDVTWGDGSHSGACAHNTDATDCRSCSGH
jgi:hypothetical protein